MAIAAAPAAPVLARLETAAPSLRDAERKIAHYILAQPNDIVHLSITELADRTDTSEATVIRCARRLGFPGYAALKIALALDLHASAPPPAGAPTADDDLPAIKYKVIESSIESLRATARLLDDD